MPALGAVQAPGRFFQPESGFWRLLSHADFSGDRCAVLTDVPFQMTQVEVDYRDAWNNPRTTKLCIYVTFFQIDHFDYCPMPGSNSMN
jgi:hypothetical protein